MQPLSEEDPQVIGAYRLLGRLGAGGMGRVYLGRSAGGRTVAVKVVHPHFALDEQFRARFRREVESARRVGGAWTAPVLDADPGAGVPWVATGYVAGPSLTQAVAEVGPLPERTVRALGAGLAEALAAVHALGLVHRDVKPSNVLLALDGPRLIDFGIARATDGTASLTSTGVSIGSPGYMAPEQILGRDVTGAADVFSLGAVLTYAATGEPPFGGDSSAALLYKVVHEEPVLGPGLAGPLRELAAACLAKSPADRPTPAEAARRLAAPEGADALVRSGWLPAPLVERVSRQAVELLDLEASGPPPAQPDGRGPGSGPAQGAGQWPGRDRDAVGGDEGVPQGAGGVPEGVGGPRADAGSGPLPHGAGRAPEGRAGRVPGQGAVAGFGPAPQGERSGRLPGRWRQAAGGGQAPLGAEHLATEPDGRRIALSAGVTAGPAGRRGRRFGCTLVLTVAGALAATTTALFVFDVLPPGARESGKPAATPSLPSAGNPTPPKPSADAGEPRATVPQAFLGTWTGSVVQSDGTANGTMTSTVTAGGKDAYVVRTSYSVLGVMECRAKAKLLSATSTRITVEEVTDGEKKALCTGAKATVTYALAPGGRLAYASDDAAGGRPTATLTRTGG
ncbi:protein kinase [Streptomyces sp. SCA3-4]|uniref:serine/threonine-protein kinase n=1 Tax=Streptomyces sichuanensis TaxID=2871810 RepID=UPI001CE3A4F7|nr:serine/threonine-protein kinase [Streptomyces sichuanensis]MCA6094609.1 protein kinase [Streptomyces sichuanensis]